VELLTGGIDLEVDPVLIAPPAGDQCKVGVRWLIPDLGRLVLGIVATHLTMPRIASGGLFNAGGCHYRINSGPIQESGSALELWTGLGLLGSGWY
jgi:hypothetical protein